MAASDSAETVPPLGETTTGLSHANELKTLREKLGTSDNRDESHELNSDRSISAQMPPLNSSTNSVAKPAGHGSFIHSESSSFNVKIEPSDASQKNITGDPVRSFDSVSSERPVVSDQGLVTEEPLEIQCGENAALLYVSKLCQGSKGPCILFQNDWLTPNELQYISGRETAKDWKRSIRYKGKSLKSLIARGLIKVHPPICDCLGCRISSPVNRGRLASKCSVSSPPSPARKRKDSSKAVWRQDGFEPGLHFAGTRQSSLSDLENCTSSQVRNGGDGLRDSPDSNSSTASECSEPLDDSPFSPAVEPPKRARSLSPQNLGKVSTMKRRATDRFQFDPRNTFFFRDIPPEWVNATVVDNSKQARRDHTPRISPSQETGGSPGGPQGASARGSAFRAVHQDALNSHNERAAENQVNQDILTRELTARAGSNSKQQQKPQSINCQPFIPFTQLPSPSPLVSPSHNSPRLLPDPLLLASPHNPSIYHQALRGGLPGVSSALHQSLMHYRLLTPPTQHNPLTQNIPFQTSFIQANAAAAAAARAGLQGLPVSHSSLSMHRGSRSSSPRNTPLVNGHTEDNSYVTKAWISNVEDERPAPEVCQNKKETEVDSENRHSQELTADRDCVIRRSPEVNTGSEERQSPTATPKASPNPKESSRVSPHKLVPRFRPDLNENVLEWTVDDVYQFVASLTGSTEIAHAFRTEHIDGHSLVLMQEDHLLNRMSIRLGPALKIIAQIKKLTENLEMENGTSN